MSSPEQRKPDQEIGQLRVDFEHTTGAPFNSFHCPILDRDEDAELCVGHIVPDALGHSTQAVVLQRKDVDAFYGSVAEADLCAFMEGRRLLPHDVLFDQKLSRSAQPKILVGGELVKHYWSAQRHHHPDHTPVILTNGKGKEVEIVLARSPELVAQFDRQKIEVIVDRDYSLSILASLLKSAHLTLFSLLGYGYALSPAGRLIGRQVLGQFFLDFRGRPGKARSELARYFGEWRNIVRPIVSLGSNSFEGTADDGIVLALYGSSGEPFAIGVFIRTNSDFHVVVLPDSRSADAMATYLSFANSPPPSIAAKLMRFDRNNSCWETSSRDPDRMVWPQS